MEKNLEKRSRIRKGSENVLVQRYILNKYSVMIVGSNVYSVVEV